MKVSILLFIVGIAATIFGVGLIVDGAVAIYFHVGFWSVVWGLFKLVLALPASVGLLLTSVLILMNKSKAPTFFNDRFAKRQQAKQ